MQRLKVSGVVRLIYRSLGVKGISGKLPIKKDLKQSISVAVRSKNVCLQPVDCWDCGFEYR